MGATIFCVSENLEKSACRASILSLTCTCLAWPRPSPLSLVGCQGQPQEAVGVVLGQRRDDFGRKLLGRNGLPGVDRAVLVLVQPPAAAGRVEPAMLVGLAVEIGIDVAIDLDAVLVVAPLVDDVVVVGIEEAAQQRAVAVFHEPADVAVNFFGVDFAFGGLGGSGAVAIDPLLDGFQPQGVLHLGSASPQGRTQPAAADAQHCQPREITEPHAAFLVQGVAAESDRSATGCKIHGAPHWKIRGQRLF